MTGWFDGEFRKMHGAGNDFLVVDGRHRSCAEPARGEVRALADRNFGVGFDQLVLMSPGSADTDAALDFWNADGTKAAACGNGTRCAADLILREAGPDAAEVRLRTPAGVLPCRRDAGGNVRVEMSPPKLDWREIPLAGERDTRSFPAPEGAGPFAEQASAVNVGNPHCVMFVGRVDAVPVAEIGPRIEHDPLFPERVNVSFAEVRGRDRIRLRVWERGSGATAACGSAACATLVAAVRLGLTGREADVEFDGGTLRIDWSDDHSPVGMSGPVVNVFRGRLEPGFLEAARAEG